MIGLYSYWQRDGYDGAFEQRQTLPEADNRALGKHKPTGYKE